MAGPNKPKTGGRAPGTPNKVNAEFRETVRKLLEDNAENVSLWLSQVATGGVMDGVPCPEKADPAKALDLLAKLAEFAAPKLNRTEVTGANGGPVQYSKVEREIVRPPNPNG